MNLQENISRIKSLMLLESDDNKDFCNDKRFSNFNMEFEHPNFDIQKLVDSGAIFVTASVDGDPNSETYKQVLVGQGNSIISLLNYECDSEDGWIRYAVDNHQVLPTEEDQNHLDKTYEGKYEQIYWSLNKLGVPFNMVEKNNK